MRHRFSHIDAMYVPWLVEVGMGPGGEVPVVGDGVERERRWADAVDRAALALPVAQQAVLADL